MSNYRHLDFSEQINLFQERGMIIEDIEKASNKLRYINYYKLKELSYPFFVNGDNGEKYYKSISFDTLVTRYYQDKKLRLALMSCIEKIEIAFKTRFSYHLGKQHGPYGYLKFNNWCDKETYCKQYLQEKQGDFKKRLKDNGYLYKSQSIKEHFHKVGKKDSYDKIPIWLYVEFATFGDILYLYGLMSKKNKEKISNDFDSTPNEIESWLESIKFVRNQIAHNSNIIDLRFRTKPKLREEWKKFVCTNSTNESISGIADAIIIITFLVTKINPSYTFNDIQRVINKLVYNDDLRANKLGYHDVLTSKKSISTLNGRFKKNIKSCTSCKYKKLYFKNKTS